MSNQLTFLEKPIEEIKPNRWITIREQIQFCEFLSYLGINFNKLDWCASEWEKYRCSENNSHSKKVRYLACGRRGICPRCSMSYASQRANLMYQWVKQNLADRLDFDLKLNQIVLTLPKGLHDIEKKLFSKMIKKFMFEFKIEAYGYSIQTRHSENPLAERYVHSHLLSLNIKQENGRLVENEYYFDVDKMRDVWKGIIEKYTDSAVEGSVNLHTEYASVFKQKWKVVHMFAYLYRYPVQDLFSVQVRKQSINYVQSLQFEKNSTSTIVREKVMDLFEEEKPRLVWCGLLTSTKKKELISLICSVGSDQEILSSIPNDILQIEEGSKPAFEWKNIPDIKKEMEKRAKECRDCGSPYEDWPYERGQYEGDNEPEVFR